MAEATPTTQPEQARHTPGPWEHGNISDDARWNPSHIYAGGPHNGIAQVYGIWTNADFASAASDSRCAEGMANARLIAAAPDGYALVKRLLGLFDDGFALRDGDGAMCEEHASVEIEARAFIAKAKGGVA
jgi:hypothetical protein